MKDVEKVIDEASKAIKDEKRTIKQSAIPKILKGALVMGVGAVSFHAFLPRWKDIGRWIRTAFLAMVAIIGGITLKGFLLIIIPATIIIALIIVIIIIAKKSKLRKEKTRLLTLALEKLHAIVEQLKQEVTATKERADYLNSLNITLKVVIRDLQADVT